MNVSFDVILLDVYGNALPAQHPVPLEVVYNDPLAPIGEWPWMSSSYSFRQHTGNQALLTVLLHLNPFIADEGDPEAQRRTIDDAAEKYRLIADQVGDPNTSASISSTVFADPMVVDRTGQTVVSSFAQYITGTVLPYIATLTTPPYPPPPAPLVLEFVVNRSYVTTIATDIFELTVATNIWRLESKVKPDIQRNIPAVQRVSSPLAAMPNPPQLSVTTRRLAATIPRYGRSQRSSKRRGPGSTESHRVPRCSKCVKARRRRRQTLWIPIGSSGLCAPARVQVFLRTSPMREASRR